MKFSVAVFLKEAILFGFTLGLGLYTAYYYNFYSKDFLDAGQIKFTMTDFIILLVLFVSMFFISRHKKVVRFSLKFFLILVVFSGSQVVLGVFLPLPWDLILAAVFAVVFSRSGNVLIHDLGIMLGIGGIAAVFGLSISVEFGLILLVALSFYDIVAVYATKHMVTMAKSMVDSGAIFGFLIPFEFKGFFYGRDQARARVGENFMILGSGDIGLPLIFISSLVKISLASAIITAGFSLLGLFLTHILFINQASRRAMAALPPIATMTIVGYLIILLV